MDKDRINGGGQAGQRCYQGAKGRPSLHQTAPRQEPQGRRQDPERDRRLEGVAPRRITGVDLRVPCYQWESPTACCVAKELPDKTYQRRRTHSTPRNPVCQMTATALVSTMTAASREIASRSPSSSEIGQRDQGDHQGRDDGAQGIGVKTTVMFSITTTMPTRRLVASSGVDQRGWIIFSRYRSTGTARCTRAANMACREGMRGDAAWEDRRRVAQNHLERGDHEQQAGHD